MEKIVENGKEFFTLSNVEEERCIALLARRAKPPDFGYDNKEAALILTWFVVPLETALKEKRIPKAFIKQARDLSDEAHALARTFSADNEPGCGVLLLPQQ